MENLINYFIVCISLLSLIIINGLIIEVMENINFKYSNHIFGKSFTMISAFIGTPIHELGHLLFAILFAHKVEKVILFPTKKGIEQGYLGCVSHSWNKKSFFQKFGNFFIGVGPMISGPIAILILLKILLPEIYTNTFNFISDNVINGQVSSFFKTIVFFFLQFFNFNILTNYKFYLFLFLAMSISCHMGLSWPDIKHSIFSLVFLIIFIVGLGVISFIFSPMQTTIINTITMISCMFGSILNISITFAIINFLILKLCFKLFG